MLMDQSILRVLFLMLMKINVQNYCFGQSAEAIMFLNTNYSISHNLLARPRGVVHFVQTSTSVNIYGVLIGLKPLGWHGLNILQMGTVHDGCPTVHFNPDRKLHGGPSSIVRHVGDLGNIRADINGVAQFTMTDSIIELNGAYSIIGRTLSVQRFADDLGIGRDQSSIENGNSGLALMCGVIGVLTENYSSVKTAYQSSLQLQFANRFLYQIPPKPKISYDSQMRASATLYSIANFTNAEPARVLGELQFWDQPSRGTVRVTGSLHGLPPGLHGLHVRQFGDLANNCQTTGEHFNPSQSKHGSAYSMERHAGDLSNILVSANGTATVMFEDRALRITGATSVIGRTIALTECSDDLGIGSQPRSSIDGNSGAVVACGLIGVANMDYSPLGLPIELVRLASTVVDDLRNNPPFRRRTDDLKPDD